MNSFMYHQTFMMLLAVILTFLFLNLPLTIGFNLGTDKAALLTFSKGLIGKGTKINWKDTDEDDIVCSGKWKGVNCKSSCVNCTTYRVTAIRLPGSGLFGPIVARSIGNLTALETLSLGSNSLYGTIPPDIFSIDTLRFIFLQHNKFCGDIRPFKDFPPRLLIVDFSFNAFTGHIPQVLSMLRLTNLSLNNNAFSDTIPNITLTKHRMFNYSVPYLNLSYNNLEGPIPDSLQNFSADSFIKNYRLCGKPLTDCSDLAPAPAPLSIAPFSERVGLVAFVASLVVILFLLV